MLALWLKKFETFVQMKGGGGGSLQHPTWEKKRRLLIFPNNPQTQMEAKRFCKFPDGVWMVLVVANLPLTDLSKKSIKTISELKLSSSKVFSYLWKVS